MLESWIFMFISGSGVMYTETFHSKAQCEQVQQWATSHAYAGARTGCEKLAPGIKERAADFSKKITKKLEEKAKEEIHD